MVNVPRPRDVRLTPPNVLVSRVTTHSPTTMSSHGRTPVPRPLRRIENDDARAVTARRGALSTLRKCAQLAVRCGLDVTFTARYGEGWEIGFESERGALRQRATTRSEWFTRDRDGEWLQDAPWKVIKHFPDTRPPHHHDARDVPDVESRSSGDESCDDAPQRAHKRPRRTATITDPDEQARHALAEVLANKLAVRAQLLAPQVETRVELALTREDVATAERDGVQSLSALIEEHQPLDRTFSLLTSHLDTVARTIVFTLVAHPRPAH